MANANQPLYGQAQQAGFLNNLNQLANNSISSLQGQLARTGGLNSGAMTSGATQIGLGRMGQQANYLTQVPMLNRQAQLQAAQTYGGLGNQLMSVAPRTQATNQFTQGTGTGLQQQTYNPSILSDIGQGLGIAGGVMGMPGFGGMFGGGGAAAPTGGATFTPPDLLNSSSFAGAGSPYGAAVGGGLPGLGPGQTASWLPNPFSLPGYQGGQG